MHRFLSLVVVMVVSFAKLSSMNVSKKLLWLTLMKLFLVYPRNTCQTCPLALNIPMSRFILVMVSNSCATRLTNMMSLLLTHLIPMVRKKDPSIHCISIFIYILYRCKQNNRQIYYKYSNRNLSK